MEKPTPTTLARRDGGLQGFIDAIQPRLAEVATDHLTPERMLKVFAAAANSNSDLMKCTVESLASSLLVASQLGLEPASPLGHLYLVPYGKKCTPIIGYKGMMELIRRTGEVKRINAQVFYQQEVDNRTVRVSLEPPSVEHQWSGETYNDKDLAGSYCVVEGMHGETYVAICSRAEIDARMKRGAAKDSGPWGSDYPAMARKSAIRKLFGGGTVPISAEKMNAISTAMALDGDSAGPRRRTASMRRVDVFAPPVVDTTAEPALPPGDEDPRAAAVRISNELGATDEQWDQALEETGLLGKSEWTTEESDAQVAALERILGV
jgi:recombination protein RecT